MKAPNAPLADWLAQVGMSQVELADAVNDRMQATGGRGGVTDRTVRRWLSGEVRSPQARQARALAEVAERPLSALGFVPRRRRVQEVMDPVKRRQFVITTGVVTAVSVAGVGPAAAGGAPAVPAARGPRPRVGMSDVDRLTARLADLVAADDRFGGTARLEARAVALAQQALALQEHATVSTRVRNRLYALAASFTSSALWVATDGGRLEAAQRHRDRAVMLAGLSGDGAEMFRAWGHAAALARHLGCPGDALAADDAARSVAITRRDPLFASLVHARTAVHHADTGATTAALRSLGHAEDSLTRAQPAPRPPWVAFYDAAELELLAATAHGALGRWADAEAHARAALAQLRPHLLRNAALTRAHLARAQLEQGALEEAVATAGAVPPAARHGRTGRLLETFSARLESLAPGTPEARAWAADTRQKGRA
ncbi:Tat pathway signal protein [Streptomyces sp. CA-181903]|uniref:Tat pathway signal protein n=1 Tax=Streptomyces sp. CA-181903 TaxID=3240055 RepID=UPI003D8B624A